jgi:hypothetical protein
MKYRLIAAVACGMCLINLWHSWHDARIYGGTDLRIRVVGARALMRGINPYTLQQTADLDPALRDPDQRDLSRCTYPPTLLLFYAPFSSMPYPAQRALWMILEWSVFASSVVVLRSCLPSRESQYWFSVMAIGLIGGSSFWRLHVERGQYYIFVVLLISVGIWLIRKTRHTTIAGCLWGVAICLRPTSALLVLPWFTNPRNRTAVAAIVTALLLVVGATLKTDPVYWRDFLHLSGAWESALINTSPDAARETIPVSEPTDGSPTDGYLTAMLPGFASNLTFISLSRSLQTTFECHPDPVTVSRLGKLVWLVLICVIGLLHYRNRRPESDATENRVLTGVCLMLVTDYFLPIRIEYADVMFLIPMALLMPVLIRPEHRIFALIGVFAMLIHQVPMNDLPFNMAAVTSMMRSGVVLYLLVRFSIVQQPETSLDHTPASTDSESTSSRI